MSVEEWSLEVTSNDIDYTNSESSQDSNLIAYTNRMTNCKDVTLTITAFYDNDNLPSASPPNFQSGATISTVLIYVNKAASRKFTFTSLIVLGDAVTMRIKDKLMVRATLRPNGSWTYPT